MYIVVHKQEFSLLDFSYISVVAFFLSADSGNSIVTNLEEDAGECVDQTQLGNDYYVLREYHTI